MNFLPFRPKKGEAFTAYLSPEFLTGAYLSSDVDWSAHDCFISKNGGKFYPTTNKPQNIERNGINRVMISEDGESFTSVDFESPVNLVYVDYVDSKYFACGESDNNLYVSEDGETWTPKNVGIDVRSVVKSGDYYVAAGVNGVKRSLDLDTWEDFGFATLPDNKTWYSVIYEDSMFIACGSSNTLVTSTDGYNWTTRNTGFDIRSITKVGSYYIASGSGTLKRSLDLDTWSDFGVTEGIPEANQWTGVAYGNGLFVAVSTNGTNRIMTSTDGITWTPRVAPVEKKWYDIVYADDIFVAVGLDAVMTSPDGITWTPRTAAEANVWQSVTYGGGLFVAVSDDGTNRVMTSPDGITWTSQSAAEANPWTEVTYGNGVFVAVAYSGTNRFMTSEDGETWTPRTPGETKYWLTVTFGDGLFVALAGDATNGVATSTDGVTWSLSSHGGGANSWRSVKYANGEFMAVSSDQTNRIMSSVNGTTWAFKTSFPIMSNSWWAVAYGNGNWVATSIDGANRAIAFNSSLFAPMPTFSSTSSKIYKTEEGFILFDSNNNIYYLETNLFARKTVGQINSITFDGETYVSVGNSGKVMYSTDGKSWTDGSGSESNTWNSVSYGGGTFVAVASTGTNRAMTSTDGIAWTPRTAAEANTWRSVAYGNGLFAAVSQDGTNRVMTSPDGITWTPRTAAEANQWQSIAYSGGVFVAVSSDGTNRIMVFDETLNTIHVPVKTFTGATVAVYKNGTGFIVFGASSLFYLAENVFVKKVSETVNDVTTNGSLLVAVGSNVVITSEDGITWTPRTVAEANLWYSVTYGDNKFVAVAQTGTNRVMTSPDGITWTSRTAAEANQWLSVSYGGGKFVAVSNDGTNRVMTSVDGITWVTGTTAENNQWRSVAYGGGKFVSVANSSKEKFTRGKGVLILTATEMNANHIILTLDELNSVSCLSQSVIIYTDGAEDINVDGSDADDTGVINFTPDVLSLITVALQHGFVLANTNLQANGNNYYGLRFVNARYLIIRENLITKALSFSYKGVNTGKDYTSAWNSKANLIYVSTQNIV